jgi:carboxypeptidase Taq
MAVDISLYRGWANTLADLAAIDGVLGWDRAVAMPASGATSRSHQLETLAALAHRELTRPGLDEILAAIQSDPDAELLTRREAELLARMRDRALRVPEDLVRAISAAESETFGTWVSARRRGDWNAVQGPLARLIDLKRAEAWAISAGQDPYDAMLDNYEPGATRAELAPLFTTLATRLTSLVATGTAHTPAPLPERVWPHDRQMQLARDIARMIGFDFELGRIAESAHPFTSTLGDGDVRFTTRVDERNPISNVLTVLHEAGHALYEQGFAATFRRSVLRDAPSLGAHEAQARFWENHIGGSPEFWRLITPRMRELFPDAMAGISAEHLYAAATGVRPSLIRVEADEVTYNLHIVLRFELECALFDGTLPVAELPDAWNARIHQLLGVSPASPTTGVLQDVHWMDGTFGYFPTYTLGNVYAAQLAETLDSAIGGIDDAIARGAFGDIHDLLRTRIYRFGALLPTSDLIMQATGQAPAPDALLRHLERRATAPLETIAV